MKDNILYLESLTYPNDKAHTQPQICDEGKIKEYESLVSILQKERINTLFQPIVSLKTAETYGYEALSRIVGPSVFNGPEQLFAAAHKFGLATKLEMLCRNKSLNRASELGIKKNIFLNIDPSVIDDIPPNKNSVTSNLAKNLFGKQSNVILELTENIRYKDGDLFAKALAHYRNQGFVIAIDDFGSGFAGLNMLVQIEPQIVKIDRFLISNIEKSTVKRFLLEAIVAFCRKVNARIVAEGIETKEELNIVTDMKIDFGQGYLLARPEAYLQDCSAKARNQILNMGNMKYQGVRQNHNFIGSLSNYTKPLHMEDTVENALKRFKENQRLVSLPVVKNGNTPFGMINRHSLFYKLSQQFGFALYAKKSVANVLESAPLILEYSSPLEEVSLKILERHQNEAYDSIIITQNGVYLGTVEIRDILAKLTEQKIDLAAQANPLTGLPGNNIIENEIENRLYTGKVFHILYIDIDNFKSFNDHFGFEKGDTVIRLLSNLLKYTVHKWDPKGFIGHIGGDDFIAVCCVSECESVCRDILDSFNYGTKIFYDEEALLKRYYESTNRRGEVENMPLISLSIAVVTNKYRSFCSYSEIASVASEIKKEGKDDSRQQLFCRSKKKITIHLIYIRHLVLKSKHAKKRRHTPKIISLRL